MLNKFIISATKLLCALNTKHKASEDAGLQKEKKQMCLIYRFKNLERF